MAEITFVIPARNLDSLHRTLSMLSFQKDAGLRAVIVDFAGSEAIRAVVPDFEHNLPVSVVTVDSEGQPMWKSCLDAAPEAEWVCFLTPGVDFNELSVKRMRRCIDDHDAYDVFHWNLAEPNKKWGLRTRPDRVFTHGPCRHPGGREEIRRPHSPPRAHRLHRPHSLHRPVRRGEGSPLPPRLLSLV